MRSEKEIEENLQSIEESREFIETTKTDEHVRRYIDWRDKIFVARAKRGDYREISVEAE